MVNQFVDIQSHDAAVGNGAFGVVDKYVVVDTDNIVQPCNHSRNILADAGNSAEPVIYRNHDADDGLYNKPLKTNIFCMLTVDIK